MADDMKPQPVPSAERTHAGDESAPGSPQTAENICPVCLGDGLIKGRTCENCGGSGTIIEIVGDA